MANAVRFSHLWRCSTPLEINMDAQAQTVDEFCQSHRISRGTFYNLLKDDRGPRVMKVGSRTLISTEAAIDWRRRRQRSLA
jgi:predicted DNA-binding transcriptional regulator AlpA